MERAAESGDRDNNSGALPMRAKLLHRYRVARGETPVTRRIKAALYVVLFLLLALIFGAVIWAAWLTHYRIAK